jgi:hypothetical protein
MCTCKLDLRLVSQVEELDLKDRWTAMTKSMLTSDEPRWV